jgi:hypothetical protein
MKAEGNSSMKSAQELTGEERRLGSHDLDIKETRTCVNGWRRTASLGA